MNELALFAGVGGGILATKHFLGFRTVCYVEHGKYQVEVLKARIQDGYLDDAPIWDDANTFDGRPWAGLVDVVTAGFPCQPFSLAGKGLSDQDPRNGWPAVIRILREVRPRYAFLENVPGLLSKPYYRRILGELAEAGFDIEQDCISAAEMGAPHIRERLWIVAHADREADGKQYINAQAWHDGEGTPIAVADTRGQQAGEHAEGLQARQSQPGNDGGNVPDTDNQRRKELNVPRVAGDAGNVAGRIDAQAIHDAKPARDRWRQPRKESGEETRIVRRSQWWDVEPRLGRVVNELADRLDLT